MKVCEIFKSIQGEGPTTGAPTIFVRFAGCTLGCPECDTKYSWSHKSAEGQDLPLIAAQGIIDRCVFIDKSVQYVCLTGGEPLEQPLIQLGLLIDLIRVNFMNLSNVVIETSGHIPISKLQTYLSQSSLKVIQWVVDYKLNSTGKSGRMVFENYRFLSTKDAIKFVCKDADDFLQALVFLKELQKTGVHTNVYFNSIGGQPDKWLASLIMDQDLSWASSNFDIRFGVQLHKLVEMR